MIRKVVDFITHGVWHVGEKDLSGRTWWAVRQLRVVISTARGLNRHETAVRSASLSFFTIMSLVPILALVFVVFKGFGMEGEFSMYLYDLMPQHPEIADQLVAFIDNLLGRTRGGIMAVSAFGVLLWAVIQVFGSVEGAFNNIWEVKRSRSFARRFSVYMALVFLVPILLLAANSVYVGIRQRVEVFTGTVGAQILFSALSVAIVVLMFSVIYFVLPNTEVKYKNALKAGIVAGVGFSLFQVAYVFVQGYLSSYNAIYGTFAAIPLFLIWLQISWQILLFGGELSFAMQNIRTFEKQAILSRAAARRRPLLAQLTGAQIVRVVVIGDGNVAESLARELARAHGVKLAGVWSRKHNKPENLQDADLYVLAISDGAVGEVSRTLPFPAGAVVAHTAGCVDVDEIAVADRAVLYPLQTFTWGHRIENFHATPFYVEGSTPHALDLVRRVASALSDHVVEMNSKRRMHIHLAGTFANNFSNAMLSLGEMVAVDAGRTFDDLRAIIAETYVKALSMASPRAAQSGAAVRGDKSIQEKHLVILKAEHPELVELYKTVSEQIWKISKKN